MRFNLIRLQSLITPTRDSMTFKIVNQGSRFTTNQTALTMFKLAQVTLTTSLSEIKVPERGSKRGLQKLKKRINVRESVRLLMLTLTMLMAHARCFICFQM